MIETLLRLSVPTTLPQPFLAHEQGVYRSTLTKPAAGYDAYYSTWTYGGMNEERVDVGDVYISNAENRVALTKKDTLGDCETDELSWFFDIDTQTVYVHLEQGQTPETQVPIIGILRGYSKNDTQYVDDIKYEPRITSTTSIKKKVDPLTVGKMRFQDQTITLANGDGTLDGFLANPIPGSIGRVVLYDTEADTELGYYAGTVTSDTTTFDTASVKLLDIRRADNVEVIPGRFTLDDYPDISSKYVDKMIPGGYGVIDGILAIPLNEQEVGSPDITYKVGVQTNGITNLAFIKIDDEWTSEIPQSIDAANGEFTMDRTDVIGSGKTDSYEVRIRVDYRFGNSHVTNIEEVHEIIADLNERYAGIAYDASNYDITEFEAEGALAGFGSFAINEEKKLYEWIEELQTQAQRNFIFDIQGDGKRTIRTDYNDRATSDEILRAKIKSDLMKISRDFKEYASSIRMTYGRLDIVGLGGTYVNDVYEEAAIATYGFPNVVSQTIQTIFNTQAEDRADNLALDQSEVRPNLDITLHGNSLSKLDKKLYDVISVDTSRPETTELENVKRVYLNPLASKRYENPLTANRYYIHPPSVIVLEEGREYFGTFTGKVIEIDYNPTTLDYKLKLREIPV